MEQFYGDGHAYIQDDESLERMQFTCRIGGTHYNYRKKLIATDEGTRHDNSAVWLNRKLTGTVSVEGVELCEQ